MPFTPVSESPLLATFEISDFETFKYKAISTIVLKFQFESSLKLIFNLHVSITVEMSQ